MLFSSTGVFDFPKLINSSGYYVLAEINDTISLQCQFRAAVEVTVVVWLKDNIPINNTDHHKTIATTNPGVSNLIISNLYINGATTKDQGVYRCYCYYSDSVVSTNQIISDYASFNVSIKKGEPYASLGIHFIHICSA